MVRAALGIFRHLKHKKLLRRILLSYFVLSFALFSVFAAVLTATYYNNAIQYAEEASQNSINQSYHTANLTLSSTYNNFYILFNQNADVNKALYTVHFTFSDITEIHNIISQQTFSNSLVDSIYIYNRTADKLFCNTEDSTLANFYDTDFTARFRSMAVQHQTSYVPRKEVLANHTEKNVITIFYANFDAAGEADSVMAVNLDQKAFQQLVAGGTSGNISIIDSAGNVISDPDPAKINTSAKTFPYYRKISEKTASSGYLIDDIGGAKYFISFFKFPGLRWTFIDTMEYGSLRQNTQKVIFYALLLTAAFLLLGIGIAAFFASSIYSPVRNLVTELESRGTDQGKNESEMDYLSNTFRTLYVELEANKYRYSVGKRTEIETKILNGELLDAHEANRVLVGSIFDRPDSGYIVLVLRFDDFSELNDEYNAGDIALFKYAVVNIAEELLGIRYRASAVPNGPDYVSLIVSVPEDGADVFGFLADTAREIQRNLKQHFSLSLTVALGKFVPSFDKIHFSYSSAVYASGYRLFRGKGGVIRYDAIPEEPAALQYPDREEKLLLNAIKQKELKKSGVALHAFLGALHNCDPDGLLISVTQLAMTISKTFSNIDSHTYETGGVNFSTLSARLKACETVGDMETVLQNVVVSVVAALQGGAMEKKRETTDAVLRFLAGHFADSELTVDKIADSVGLSPNYLRAIFKEAQGISLTDYLTELRLAEVRRMLVETDLSAREISLKAGFPDNRYFYVIFKKNVGCTSEEYRSRHKKQGAER